jgi:hypothetical protein
MLVTSLAPETAVDIGVLLFYTFKLLYPAMFLRNSEFLCLVIRIMCVIGDASIAFSTSYQDV